jgi:zinc transport system ATP-binding protein
MSTSLVEIKEMTFSYNSEKVLEDVSLDIRQGDFVAMIGPNGGGKTTLLKLILGLLKPNSGAIRVMGQPPLQSAPIIGYLPQDVHINRSFPITAIDVVLMGLLSPRKRSRRESASDRRRAMEALERLEVAPLAERKIGDLSGGQRQRVFIARALVTNPKLMLLDEPTASIDSKGQVDVFMMLKELNKDVTFLVVSHDLLVISRYAKSVACVNRRVHYHDQAEITGDMLESMYSCTAEEVCPVELLAHGLPQRVLKEHEN